MQLDSIKGWFGMRDGNGMGWNFRNKGNGKAKCYHSQMFRIIMERKT